METKEKERGFSVEMKAMNHISSLSFGKGLRDQVLIEGTIGKLNDFMWTDGEVLVVNGNKGTIYLDLAKTELEKKLQEDS